MLKNIFLMLSDTHCGDGFYILNAYQKAKTTFSLIWNIGLAKRGKVIDFCQTHKRNVFPEIVRIKQYGNERLVFILVTICIVARAIKTDYET